MNAQDESCDVQQNFEGNGERDMLSTLAESTLSSSDFPKNYFSEHPSTPDRVPFTLAEVGHDVRQSMVHFRGMNSMVLEASHPQETLALGENRIAYFLLLCLPAQRLATLHKR